jgi:hypothetical protein
MRSLSARRRWWSPAYSNPNAGPECMPAVELSRVLVQSTNATVYAPQGRWGTGTAAVKVVPIETSSGIGTGGAPTTVVTGSVPNSCSCNSTTGTTVCTGNNTDVFLINGTTLSSTVTSGATANQKFSGGSCHELRRGGGFDHQQGVDHAWPGHRRNGRLPIPRSCRQHI